MQISVIRPQSIFVGTEQVFRNNSIALGWMVIDPRRDKESM